MNVQIRLRTSQSFNDLEYIKDWLDISPRGFAFEHEPNPDNHHYHIYLFGIPRKDPTPMRRYLGRYLPTKECYSVGITCGKEKKAIVDKLAYQYGTTDKLLDPVWSKGFSKEELYKFEIEAAAHYKQKEDRQNRNKQVVTEILVINEEKLKPDRVWERLMMELIENPTKYDGKSVHQIKSMISVEYLRKLKAIPRPSDLHRYAVSLFHIVKYEAHIKEAEIPDDALESEYLR